LDEQIMTVVMIMTTIIFKTLRIHDIWGFLTLDHFSINTYGFGAVLGIPPILRNPMTMIKKTWSFGLSQKLQMFQTLSQCNAACLGAT
jgi:hypothetical protein